MASIAASELGKFQYDDLSDPAVGIRLVRILPPESSKPDDICCAVTTWRVGQEPDYMAVSYTWGMTVEQASYTYGEPIDESSIILNGKAFVVRPNCFFLLHQARENGMRGYLWIDAICINQMNNHEKSKQVAMMGDIYRKAACTYVWIGFHNGDSKYLFEAIGEHIDWASRLVDDAYVSGELVKSGLLRDRRKWKSHRKRSIARNTKPASLLGAYLYKYKLWTRAISHILDLPSGFAGRPKSDITRLLEALYVLLLRPYFERLWIIQELALSRNPVVFCGNSCIPLEAIKEFETNLFCYCERNNDSKLLYERHRTLQAIFDFVQTSNYAKGPRCSLSRLTDQTYFFECSDPRDRIFGVMSLVDWRCRRRMVPDYTKKSLALAIETICNIFETPMNEEELMAQPDFFADQTKEWPGFPSLPAASATSIAGALRLTSGHAEIDALLQQRRSEDRHRVVNPAEERLHERRTKIRDWSDYWCRIYLDDATNELRSCLRKRDEEADPPTNEVPMDSPRSRSVPRGVPFHTFPHRTMKTAGHLCATLPIHAQAGDILLPFKYVPNVALVVRDAQDPSQRLQIIGQAVFERGVELCRGGQGCACGLPAKQHPHAAEEVAVWFDPLDLLLFTGQGLTQDDDAASEEVPEEAGFYMWDGDDDLSLALWDYGTAHDPGEDVDVSALRLVTSVTAPGNVFSSFAQAPQKGWKMLSR